MKETLQKTIDDISEAKIKLLTLEKELLIKLILQLEETFDFEGKMEIIKIAKNIK